MLDFRISVEELENEAMISEMARAIIQEALEESEDSEKAMTMPIEETIVMPF
jgi:hypothetical protein